MLCSRERRSLRGGRSLDREVLIAPQPDCAGQRREPERALGDVGNVEEGVSGLSVQIAIVLLCTAMAAMVGIAQRVPVRSADLPVSRPGRELPGERIIHGQNVEHRELHERLTEDRAAPAMDADDFDRLPALTARHGGCGHAGLVGDDRELRGVGIYAEPASKFGQIGTRIEIQALEALIPLGAGTADRGALFGRDIEVSSIHGF